MTTNTYAVSLSHDSRYFPYHEYGRYTDWSQARRIIAALAGTPCSARITNPDGLISWAGRLETLPRKAAGLARDQPRNDSRTVAVRDHDTRSAPRPSSSAVAAHDTTR